MLGAHFVRFVKSPYKSKISLVVAKILVNSQADESKGFIELGGSETSVFFSIQGLMTTVGILTPNLV